MEGDRLRQLVCQVGAYVWHAATKQVFGQEGVPQVISFNALPKGFSVCGDTAHRNATEINTVIALNAPNESCFAGLAL